MVQKAVSFVLISHKPPIPRRSYPNHALNLLVDLSLCKSLGGPVETTWVLLLSLSNFRHKILCFSRLRHGTLYLESCCFEATVWWTIRLVRSHKTSWNYAAHRNIVCYSCEGHNNLQLIVTLLVKVLKSVKLASEKTNCLLVLKRTVSFLRSVSSWNSREVVKVTLLMLGVGFLNDLTYQTVEKVVVLTGIFGGILVGIRSLLTWISCLAAKKYWGKLGLNSTNKLLKNRLRNRSQSKMLILKLLASV